jgi:GNAT superfamily N-acetyltransferase
MNGTSPEGPGANRLVFVYNADGGKLDALLDAGHKIVSPGTYQCSLCKLTHGAFSERNIWKKFRETTTLELTFLHRDEFEERYGTGFTYPIVLRTGPDLEVLMSTGELNAMSNPEELIATIEERTRPATRIERLSTPPAAFDLDELSLLLADAVGSGAAVSFLAPFTPGMAKAWWQRTLADSHPRAIFLVARDGGDIRGTVQLHPAWAPNQPHRAEVAKLLVDRAARRGGLGTRLMGAIEEEARAAGFHLLTLDAKRGTPAEKLYRRLGWMPVGTIPGFALDPDGTTLHDAVLFFKALGGPVFSERQPSILPRNIGRLS